jgi:Holliday junction resolvase RusA-like endonuclease
MNTRIILPGNTPSLKNSKRIVQAGQRPRLIPSKAYQKWAAPLLWQLKQCELVGRQWRYPVQIDFHFYRKDKSRFDFINLGQGPLDLLVELGILADDDMRHVVPGKWAWEVDKKNPRVELVIREAQ